MRRSCVAIAVALVLPTLVSAAPQDRAAVVIDDFETARGDDLPDGWQTRDAETATRVYRVAHEDGGRFLRAEARAESAQIATEVSFRLADHPIVSWRWRVRKFPSGTNEREKAGNDSAAGVYVLFRGGLMGMLPRSIKYVWSATVPAGSTFSSPGYGNAKIIVLRSGTAGAGAWQVERVDVADDYRRLFDDEPPDPRGIAVLTDADQTGTAAAADYDDFRALATVAAAADDAPGHAAR